ncbi:MAG: hypothetical protein PVJ02_17870 [Gemmatimonadota bacterium]|jgi:hypothetical protein
MRTPISVLALVLGLMLLGGTLPRSASAQTSPSDSAAVLLDAATHFEAQGQTAVADALYRLIVGRFPETDAARRARLRLADMTTVARNGEPGAGRVELVVWTTTYGLWLGVAVPGALGAEDPEPYGVGLLLGGPAGYLTGKMLAHARPLTEGQARAITLGGTWGTWQGLGWVKVLDLGAHHTDCFTYPTVPDGSTTATDCYESVDDTRATFTGMVVGGVAGIAAGTVLSRRDITAGVATTVNFGALWGTWFGFAAGYLAGQEDDGLLATTLLGGDAGLLGTALLAPGWNPSRSRARIVSIYGVIGGLSGLGLDLVLQPDDDKVAVGLPLAGSLLGLALGAGTTRSYDAPGGARRGEGGGLPSGALISVRDGSWTVDPPVPYPVMVERPGPSGMERRPALGVTLLSARLGGPR